MADLFPRDHYGDPRDYAEEARAILAGTLTMRPTEEHLREMLKSILHQ